MNSEKAKRLLCHYFRLLFERNGLRWDSDNESEISEIVDSILSASGVSVR